MEDIIATQKVKMKRGVAFIVGVYKFCGKFQSFVCFASKN